MAPVMRRLPYVLFAAWLVGCSGEPDGSSSSGGGSAGSPASGGSSGDGGSGAAAQGGGGMGGSGAQGVGGCLPAEGPGATGTDSWQDEPYHAVVTFDAIDDCRRTYHLSTTAPLRDGVPENPRTFAEAEGAP